MSTRLGDHDSDDFNPQPRLNGDMWFRSDLGEIRALLNGSVVTLFKADGTPGKLPDDVVRVNKV